MTDPKPAPAPKPDASGAIQDDAALAGVDLNHPAVDANPREGLPPESNQVDFNDPTLSGAEAVAKNLEADDAEARKGDKAPAAKA